MKSAAKRAAVYGDVILIHAVSVGDAERLVRADFKKNKLKLDVFEAQDTNLYFCSTEARVRTESYYIYIVLNSEKFISEKNQ